MVFSPAFKQVCERSCQDPHLLLLIQVQHGEDAREVVDGEGGAGAHAGRPDRVAEPGSMFLCSYRVRGLPIWWALITE